MNVTMFLSLIVFFSGVCTLLTEAVKTFFKNAERGYSANLIALINAVIVGIGGTSAAYVILSIPFNATNIIAIVVMTIAIWIGSMVGYDKVIQFIKQLSDLK